MSKTAIMIYIFSIGVVIVWLLVSFVLNRPVEVPVVNEATLAPLDGQLDLTYMNDLQARSINKVTPELEL